MKLQISFDFLDLKKALRIAKEVAEHADILEVGSPLLYQNGATAVLQFKTAFPHKQILADAKLVDRVEDIIPMLSRKAADLVTVLAGTSNKVISKAISSARAFDTKVVVDMLDAYSIPQSARDAQLLHAHAVHFHEPHDLEGGALALVDQWDEVRGNTELPIFISGHINRDNVEKLLALKPDGLVIGSAIVEAGDPAAEAKFFRGLLNKG